MDVNELGNKAQETANRVAETAQDWTEKAKGGARDGGAAADLYVHEYAWTSVLAVAVIAGLVGFLLGRRES